MWVFIFGHILAISLNNISRYIEEDFSSLSSVNMREGTVESKRICSEILFLINFGEDYMLKRESKINSLLFPLLLSKKINPLPVILFTLTESLS